MGFLRIFGTFCSFWDVLDFFQIYLPLNSVRRFGIKLCITLLARSFLNLIYDTTRDYLLKILLEILNRFQYTNFSANSSPSVSDFGIQGVPSDMWSHVIFYLKVNILGTRLVNLIFTDFHKNLLQNIRVVILIRLIPIKKKVYWFKDMVPISQGIRHSIQFPLHLIGKKSRP